MGGVLSAVLGVRMFQHVREHGQFNRRMTARLVSDCSHALADICRMVFTHVQTPKCPHQRTKSQF